MTSATAQVYVRLCETHGMTEFYGASGNKCIECGKEKRANAANPSLKKHRRKVQYSKW